MSVETVVVGIISIVAMAIVYDMVVNIKE